MLQGLITSGRIVDLILALVALEVGVVAWLGRGRRGFGAVDALVNALAGVGLLLALRAALTGSDWTAVSGWLGAALVAHMADLGRRWRGSGPERTGSHPRP